MGGPPVSAFSIFNKLIFDIKEKKKKKRSEKNGFFFILYPSMNPHMKRLDIGYDFCGRGGGGVLRAPQTQGPRAPGGWGGNGRKWESEISKNTTAVMCPSPAMGEWSACSTGWHPTSSLGQ